MCGGVLWGSVVLGFLFWPFLGSRVLLWFCVGGALSVLVQGVWSDVWVEVVGDFFEWGLDESLKRSDGICRGGSLCVVDLGYEGGVCTSEGLVWPVFLGG